MVTALNGPAKLFRNVTAGSGHLAGFKLKGTKSNRHGLGAEFSVTLPGGRNSRGDYQRGDWLFQ